ncbi:putative RNA uridine N3 methyltransferase [Stetteria hydrogenophila]
MEVALPASVLSVEAGLQWKTVKAGVIARVLTVYRVDAVHVFMDPDTSERDLRLLEDLLRYAMTPPHLRRRLVPLKPSLRYAGLMPPVQIPRHLPPRDPRPGDLIDGVVEEARGDRCLAWLGSPGYAEVRGCRARPGSLVTVKVTGRDPSGRLLGVQSSWGDVYAGFTVHTAGSVEEVAGRARRRGLAVVATSRLGDCVKAPGDVPVGPRGLLLVFGGPRRGLLDYTDKSLYDAVVNTVPGQGSLTVRTEEALQATLAIINLALT